MITMMMRITPTPAMPPITNKFSVRKSISPSVGVVVVGVVVVVVVVGTGGFS